MYSSYGGVVKSEALADYVHRLKEGYKREQGVGMVRRLVYMTSFVLPEGATLMSALGGKPLPWFKIEVLLHSIPQILARRY